MFEKAVLFAQPSHIWFERSEASDRRLVSQRYNMPSVLNFCIDPLRRFHLFLLLY